MNVYVLEENTLNIGKVIGAAIAFFLIAILFPIAISEVANATTTNWNASVITIFQTVLPIIAVIGVAVSFLPEIKGALGKWFKPTIMRFRQLI